MKRPRMVFLLWRKRHFRPFGAPKRGENIASERGVQRRRKGGRLIRGREDVFLAEGRMLFAGGGAASRKEGGALRGGGVFFRRAAGCGLHSGSSLWRPLSNASELRASAAEAAARIYLSPVAWIGCCSPTAAGMRQQSAAVGRRRTARLKSSKHNDGNVLGRQPAETA